MGDFKGDGVPDIVTGHRNDGRLSVPPAETSAATFQLAPLQPFSLGTQMEARQALPVFKGKFSDLAEQRGIIGAFQSRIEVTANVLQAGDENFQAAEGRIRDADIAHESSNLVRLNILRETASVMLAQANQQSALALQLLS